jgi:hypothetical protein
MKADIMINKKYFIIIAALFLCRVNLRAENIDPYKDGSQYAYGENIGWINFEPSATEGVHVDSNNLDGFIWAENIGWINLSPSTGGVANDGSGNLSGYAWGENVGWINFDPNVPGDSNDYGVTIDSDGNFDGYAWGENIGWLNFGISEYYVVVCKVTFEDLANFADDWLSYGQGNLDEIGVVDFSDYRLFAPCWLDYCPDDWPLK